MQPQLESISNLERRVTFGIDLDAINADVTARLKKYAPTVKMNGFRKGKVPFAMVQQQYGPQFHQEALELAVSQTFNDFVREQKLRIADEHPHFEMKEPEENSKVLTFEATFEVFPEVQVGDLSAVTLKKPTLTITDVEIDKTLEVLRKQRSTYLPVDRAAENGDRVDIDFKGILDGTPFEGGTAEGYQVVLGAGRLLKDFEAQILGKNAGESVTFPFTFPEDYHGKDVAGKQVEFTITLNEVAGPVLPEVNEEFAKQFGLEDGNVEALRAEIRKNLENETRRRLRARVREQATNAILEATTVELPKVLVEQECQQLVEQTKRDFAERGLSNDIPADTDVFKTEAERRVKLGLILADVVKANDLYAKPEQIRALVDEFAESFEDKESVVNWYYSDPKRLEEVEAIVIDENMVTWIAEKAQIEEVAISFEELMGYNA